MAHVGRIKAAGKLNVAGKRTARSLSQEYEKC
jgi:hypothetical protein